MEIITKTTVEAWKKALHYILDEGSDFTDHDNRICRETLNLTTTIEHPEKDFETPIELMQAFDLVYPSKEELSTIMLNKDISTIYEYSYGPRIFNFLNQKDQINDFIIPLLKKDPRTRRGIVCLFNPVKDMDLNSKNVPSLLFLYFKIKDNKLHLTCYIRSNDFFIGWPGNIYQIYVLQKYVAERVNIETGSLATISSSAHIFHEHIEMIEKIIKG